MSFDERQQPIAQNELSSSSSLSSFAAKDREALI
jgi:hypothetical protein